MTESTWKILKLDWKTHGNSCAISCFIKIQIGLIFVVLAYSGCPGKEAVKLIPVYYSDHR